MVLQDAYEIAQGILDSQVRPAHGVDIVICSCVEYPTAWVFGYNTRQFLVGKEIRASLVGNGPVVVPKSGKEAFLGSSGSPIERQIGHL
ncbi:YrhB domain-containing protein [Alloactinosynnema sp. L-07]|uniref:YrhB domain-containing protein n=1 Tax=Alloactinosynnema sp. L-07 TaxID=1653480 RepID=UPI00155FD13D|nr:YrhB domain-containing protein [Alloactinosynnema sp. L-07]